MNLHERIAVVTGAQQGIGRAIALALGQAGATIVANILDDEDAANSLKNDLMAQGTNCHLVRADLSDSAQIETVMRKALELGGTDILINNAAMFPREDFINLPVSTWQDTLTVNLTAPFLCSQAAARQMIEHKRGGSIINITSGAAFRGTPRAAHYVSSKAGLVGLTRACSQELAVHNIRVNAIAPGLTDTAQPRIAMSDEELYAAGELAPRGKIAQPEDIAGVAQFLASDAAAHVTGQTWHVNGGQYLS